MTRASHPATHAAGQPAATSLLVSELLAAYDRGTQIQPPSQGPTPLSLDQGYAVALELMARREARGERRLGHKIGFTNRTIWDRYGVHAPIWGPVWDTTLARLDAPELTVSLDGLAGPRLEPEIVFGLGAAPASPALADVAAAIEWVAHGFEIVQSLYPGWRFAAADTVAAFGLHARLYVGPAVRFADWPDARSALSSLELVLERDGVPIDRGIGANVLDGPVQALAHLAAEIERRPAMPRLAAGDVVTTGTITDAAPLVPGHTFVTRLSGPGLDGRLPGLRLTTT